MSDTTQTDTTQLCDAIAHHILLLILRSRRARAHASVEMIEKDVCSDGEDDVFDIEMKDDNGSLIKCNR